MSYQVNRPRLPWPGWPAWIAFGACFIPLILFAVSGSSALASARAQLDRQQGLIGVSAVVSGSYVSSDASSGMPQATGLYEVTVPDSAPQSIAGSVKTVKCGTNWGFPPSEDFPAQQDQLITWDETNAVYSVECGDAGTISPVTEKTLGAAKTAVQSAEVASTVSTIAFIVVPLVFAVAALILSIRRARAKKRARFGYPPTASGPTAPGPFLPRI